MCVRKGLSRPLPFLYDDFGVVVHVDEKKVSVVVVQFWFSICGCC
jgi:hypothetical protein